MNKKPKKFAELKKYSNFATSNLMKLIVPWCNGNTCDFGSYVSGSSPDGITF